MRKFLTISEILHASYLLYTENEKETDFSLPGINTSVPACTGQLEVSSKCIANELA